MANNNGSTGFKKLAESVGNLFGAAGTVASTGVKATGGVAKGGGNVVGKAANGSAGLLGTVINTVAATAKRYPKITFLASTYAAIKGIQHIVRKQKDKKEAAAQAANPQVVGAEAYDPRAFDNQGLQPAQPQMAQQLSPEQQAFLRDMQQGEQMARMEATAGQQAPQQGSWASRVSAEREQAQGTQQSR